MDEVVGQVSGLGLYDLLFNEKNQEPLQREH